MKNNENIGQCNIKKKIISDIESVLHDLKNDDLLLTDEAITKITNGGHYGVGKLAEITKRYEIDITLVDTKRMTMDGEHDGSI